MYKKAIRTIMALTLAIALMASSTALAVSSAIDLDENRFSSLELLDDALEISPFDVADVEQLEACVYSNFTVAEAKDLEEFDDFDIAKELSISSRESRNANNQLIMNRAGQYVINENVAYSHNLTSGMDWNIYMCQVTASGHAIGFIDSASAMDFAMIVQVYDSTLSVLKFQDYVDLSRNFFQGQRMRTPVTAGDIVVIGVEAVDPNSFVANSYSVGVVRITNTSPYESDDHPVLANNFGATTSGGVVASLDIDHRYDVDWYKFTHSDTTSYPQVAYSGVSNDMKAVLYREVNGVLQKVIDITNDGYWKTVTNQAAYTYYILVYSTGSIFGDYLLGVKNVKIYEHEKIIVIDFSNISGDQGSKSYYGLGSRQTTREYVYGYVKLTDTKGNPIPNFPYVITFSSQMGGSGLTPIKNEIYSTNSIGQGSAVLQIPLYASWYFHTDYIQPYDYLVNGARVIVDLPTGYTPQSSFNYKDFWHYGGQIWVGP